MKTKTEARKLVLRMGKATTLTMGNGGFLHEGDRKTFGGNAKR